jgi:4-oxalocrotonate tautomerase
MPMVTVQYATPQAKAGLAQTLAAAVTQLGAEILHKDAALTAVVVEERDAANWFIGGKSLLAHQRAAVWIDFRITAGTNTREEKAAFLAAAFAKMEQLLGPLHRESYIAVGEHSGDNYGHGGVTQNHRYFAGKFDPAKAAA